MGTSIRNRNGLTAFILIGIVLLSTTARATPLDVQGIIRNMKEAVEPTVPTTRRVKITRTAGGETVQRIASQAFKHFPDGNRMLLVILEPPDLRGNALLVQEQERGPSVMWVYSPSLRRERKLVPVDAYEHFLGTDFTYADLGLVRLHTNYLTLGTEDYQGRQAYKVQENIPEESASYSRILFWIATDSLLPIERDYYDVTGKLWKTERFEEEELLNDIPTLLRVTMWDVQGKTGTELAFDQVRYDTHIPDTLFDPQRLPQLAASPLWQPHHPPVVESK